MRFSFFTTVSMAAISAVGTEATKFEENEWPADPSTLSQVETINEAYPIDMNTFAQALAEV